MRTLLRTTVEYNRNKPRLSLPVNSDSIDTIALERRCAGWYATLDYTADDGIPRSHTPRSWIRYRNTYILEYHTNDCTYTVKIKENTDNAKLTVFLGSQSLTDDGTHNEAIA